MDFSPLTRALKKGEAWLIQQLSDCVKGTPYLRYFPTVIEAWRLTVVGLTEQFCLMASLPQGVPDFDPESEGFQELVASFGVTEAQRHRARGVNMTMFLGLMKYHRRSYRDYIEATFTAPRVKPYRNFIERCFDYLELSIINEWSRQPQKQIGKELEIANLKISIEKNRYLTIFENLPHPIFLVDMTGDILNFNHAAVDCFPDLSSREAATHDPAGPPFFLSWMRDLVREAISHGDASFSDKTLSTNMGQRIFCVYIKQTLDVSGQVTAYIVSLTDTTERKKAEEGIYRLTRAYDVLSQTSQAIVRYKEPLALFEEVCRIAVQKGHLKIAIINQVFPENQCIKTVAVNGGPPALSFLSLAKSAQTKPNITSLVIKTGSPYICNDIRKDPWLNPRAREADEKDFRALASYPLYCKNQLYATLNLYAQEKDFFSADIVTIFEEMASDISFALDNFEREKQRQEAEEKLWEATNKLQAIFKAAPLPVVAHSQSGEVLMWNPEAERVFGWKEEELLNRRLPTLPEGHLPKFQEKNRRVFAGESISQLQVQRHTRDGRLRDFLLFNTPLYDPQQNIYAIMEVLLDVTEQKKAQEQIAYMAHHDPLTGLPNRVLLKERFEFTASHARRTRTGMALGVLDLDGFKYVNDLLGHRQGDQLLCQIAERLQASVRQTDTVCRIGGDEFLILFGGIKDTAVMALILQKILDIFATPFVLEEQQAHVTISIGVAIWGEDGEDFDTLFKHADAAMYCAKKEGGNNAQFFRQEIGSLMQRRFDIEKGLRQALLDNAFTLYYQPICRVTDNVIVGAEALIRWEHPELGLLSPDQFIPIAEEANLIISLGDWVLEEACRTLRTWDDQGLPPLSIAVNISAKQLFDLTFPAFVAQVLQRYNLEPYRLGLEVTEGLFLENLESVETIMNELKAIGVGLALDDFGTGYSSMSYLKRFRIDKLKIDQCFLKDVCNGEQDAVITETIVLMTRNLGLKTVAEGVETKEQLAFLQNCRCDLYQGYFFSKPLTSGAFVDLWGEDKFGRLHLAGRAEETANNLRRAQPVPSWRRN